MSEEVLGGRVEKADFYLPFTPSLEQGYDTNPTYRLLIDVSESSAMGELQQGYYLKVNESVYFIIKKFIHVFTNSQTERVFQFLKKTQAQFTVDVLNDKTVSGHQYVQFYDVTFNSGIYTLRDFQVFKGLWQTVEGELYENLYSPSMVRFTGERLIWYCKLMPEHSLQFTHVAKITLNDVAKQGHLEVFGIEKDEQFTIPSYLYSSRKSLRFFNHEIKDKVDVILLGSERRIISVPQETQVVSNDHEPLTLQVGQYLLYHPRPRDRVD
jgi:hypothetical protein